MSNLIYTKTKAEIQLRPKQLTDMEQWLLVTVNLAKAWQRARFNQKILYA